MFRKDYIRIADAIKDSKVDELNKLRIANDIAKMLVFYYSNFKKEVFMEHCVPNYKQYQNY